MRTNFIQFAILAVFICNTAAAEVLTNEKNYAIGSSSEAVMAESKGTVLKKPVLNLESDTILIRSVTYHKSVEEVIKEDNLIIESNITNEVYPLKNLKRINKATSKVKKAKCQNCFSHKCCFKS